MALQEKKKYKQATETLSASHSLLAFSTSLFVCLLEERSI